MIDERDLLAEKFEAHPAHLRTVAYRMLGSPGEAEDAVQESWLPLRGSHERRALQYRALPRKIVRLAEYHGVNNLSVSGSVAREVSRD